LETDAARVLLKRNTISGSPYSAISLPVAGSSLRVKGHTGFNVKCTGREHGSVLMPFTGDKKCDRAGFEEEGATSSGMVKLSQR